jgi:hypothetical protein
MRGQMTNVHSHDEQCETCKKRRALERKLDAVLSQASRGAQGAHARLLAAET